MREGVDSYDFAHLLPQHISNAVMGWRNGRTFVTLKLRGGGILKSLNRFTDHRHDATAFAEMLRECAQYGVERPSSYSDVFHQRFRTPRIAFTVNWLFRDYFAGAWQEARRIGEIQEPMYKYDLNQAYLWAGEQGLPDVESLRYSENWKLPGLYVIRITPDAALPYPFNTKPIVVAETDDIRKYQITPKRVIAGVTWDRLIDGRTIIDAIEPFTFAKQIGRSYWGRWALQDNIECATFDKQKTYKRTGEVVTLPGKSWELPNPAQNFIWAQVVVNRVKRRVWEAGMDSAHIYVDAIITHKRMATSTSRGDWKLVTEYPAGIRIAGTGWYGPIGGKLEKHAGVTEAIANGHLAE